ncbi:hypothetical protein [Bradyrhizobium japonicum]|uniref:hypothetical protein n=1 Tax=Bradyrhizobium japonicum TaxID=375 RepID=UPI00040DB654|nr:hypothetical protein [Bradyrhizobium japonicum]
MRNISGRVGRAKPRPSSVIISRDPHLATAFAFIDTIEVFWPRRFDVSLKNALRAETRRRVWEEPLIINDVPIGWVLKLNQPTESALRVLGDRWQDRMSICRLHVAYDLDRQAGVIDEEIETLMTLHTHMRHRKTSDSIRNEKGTVYSIDTAYRKGRLAKTTVYYSDKPGKLDGELCKPHLEIRVLTGRAVKRLGINRPIDLFKIKPRELFSKCITMRDHAEPIIKELEKSIKPHPLINIERRVRGLLKRSDHGTLTDFRKERPRQFERLREMDVLQINDGLMWAPAKGREREVCWGKCAYYHNSGGQAVKDIDDRDIWTIDWRSFPPSKAETGSRPRVRLEPRKRIRLPSQPIAPRVVETQKTTKRDIKQAILENPKITVPELQARFETASGVMLSAVRSNFLADLEFLKQRGHLKGLLPRNNGRSSSRC